MQKIYQMFKKNQSIILLFVISFLFACGPKTLSVKNRVSSEMHHIEVGLKLLEKGKIKRAKREFQLALDTNPQLVMPYVGLALIAAKENKETEAWELLKKAENFAKNNEDKIDVLLGKIKLVCLLFTSEKLPKAEQAFQEAMQLKPGHALITYYMACVYEKAFLFNKAKMLFERVVKSENPYVLQAFNEIEKIEKIQKAHPNSHIGKEIGLKDTINKADMAALLYHELQLHQVLEVTETKIVIRDIGKEKFAKEIEAIAPLKIKEISATVDGYFNPQQKITRSSLCEILQDILIRLTGNTMLRYRFKKVKSPYKDLDSKANYYNACILGLVKGFVTPYDRTNKLFGPQKPLNGADVLMALKRLREELKLL